MEPLYFKTFDEYEKNLELVKAEIQEDQPSWLHYWFYRYLQISPFYWAMHLNQSKSKEDQKRYIAIKKFNNNWDDCDDLSGKDGIKIFSPERANTAYVYLGDVWRIDFARWWYSRARYFFKHVSNFIDKDEINRSPFIHGGMDTRMATNKDFISSWTSSFENSLKYLAKEGGYPKAIVLTINFLESKKATVRAFSDFIDRSYGVEYKNMNSTNFSFKKTKLKETTLRDCYKVYEMSIRQEKLNLFELGIKAEVLRGAIAEYKSKRNFFEKNIKIFRSYNSLKSATSRQIRYAKNLAINAGIPLFPNKREFNWVSIDLPMVEKRYIFDLLLKQAKLAKNQKDALIDFAKKEKLKDIKKEYQKIMGKLD